MSFSKTATTTRTTRMPTLRFEGKGLARRPETNALRPKNNFTTIGEQLSFSLDDCQTVGILADKLSEVENECCTLDFLAPMSEFAPKRDNMVLLQPGIYSIGPLHSYLLSHEEVNAILTQCN